MLFTVIGADKHYAAILFTVISAEPVGGRVLSRLGRGAEGNGHIRLLTWVEGWDLRYCVRCGWWIWYLLAILCNVVGGYGS